METKHLTVFDGDADRMLIYTKERHVIRYISGDLQIIPYLKFLEELNRFHNDKHKYMLKIV